MATHNLPCQTDVRLTLESDKFVMSESAKMLSEPVSEGFRDFFSSSSQSDVSDLATTDVIEVSVTEAAKLLGITERSVWRRISSKKLLARNCDGKTLVKVKLTDVIPTVTDTQETTSVTVTDAKVLEEKRHTDVSLQSLDLIREMQSKLESAVYRNGYLESLLQTKEEQLKLLPDFQVQAEKSRVLEQQLQEEAAKREELEQQSKLNEEKLVVLEEELAHYKNCWWRRFSAWFTGREL